MQNISLIGAEVRSAVKKYCFSIANSGELTYTLFIMGIGALKIKNSLFPLCYIHSYSTAKDREKSTPY